MFVFVRSKGTGKPPAKYRANTGSAPARLAVFRQEGRKIQVGFFQFSGRGARILGAGDTPGLNDCQNARLAVAAIGGAFNYA